MIAWTVAGPAYAAAFRTAGGVLFSTFGPNATVTFHASAAADETPMDTLARLRNTQSHAIGRLPISIRLLGYLPTALLIALVAATPLPWRKRIAALIVGLIFVNLFIALRVGLLLLATFSGDNELAIISPDGFAASALHWSSEFIATSPTGSWLGPIIIWMAVTGPALRARFAS